MHMSVYQAAKMKKKPPIQVDNTLVKYKQCEKYELVVKRCACLRSEVFWNEKINGNENETKT